MTTMTLAHPLPTSLPSTLSSTLPSSLLSSLPTFQRRAPTPLPSLTLRDRARLLACRMGERELTVWMLIGAAVLLVLAAATLLTLLAVAPHALLGAQGLANAGSARVLQAFVALVMWLSLMGLGAAAWSTGSFDRLLRSRAAQAACLGAVVTAAVWLAARVAMQVAMSF